MKLYAVKIEYSRFRNEPILATRDIRALTLKFIPKNSEYYKILNWHEKDVPRVIYSKPNNSFAIIYSTIKDVADYIESKIEKRFVRLENKRIPVKGVKKHEIEWKIEKLDNGLYMYHTRTEIITGVNDTEWKINTAVKNAQNNESLENDVLKNIITRTITHTYKNWFGFSPNLTDFKIKIVDGRHILDYTYKEGERYPAWKGYFLSNYKLPSFVGYKIGLGKGEIEIKAKLSEEKAKRLLA